mmetsp:Transcript_76336/g.221634  ORF Transcript_76336/g.221634 Transcript_76336/m.221634 type:complete len:120 (-) Transcript_76336:1768-2127(-)
MNEWIQHKLEDLPIGDHYKPKDFLNYNGHYTPQTQFLISYPSEIRMVDHVLRMDNLEPEFNALMKAYGISVEMLPHKKNAARNETSDLEAGHFDQQTMGYLDEQYGDDVDILHDRTLSG